MLGKDLFNSKIAPRVLVLLEGRLFLRPGIPKNPPGGILPGL